MRPEIPIEIEPLRRHLRQEFTDLLPEATSGDQENRERNFLSRALAAYAIGNLSGCSKEEACGGVVDGGGDGGIDALYYSPNSHTLWIIQSKFIASGRGEPPLGDASKFADGIENLLSKNWEAFAANETFSRLIPQLEIWFADSSLRVRVGLLYSSTARTSEDRKLRFERISARFNKDDDYFSFEIHNLTSISDWLTGLDQGLGVTEVKLQLLDPGWIRKPYETIYGMLPIVELHRLKQEHGDRLIAANIRRYRGQTDVNQQIMATVRDEPENFFYLNNGLTAYCERLQVDHADRANAKSKRFTAHGFSIVNGAQTLGSVHRFFEEAQAHGREGFVFLKVISLERRENEREFAERITRSTNFQNQINARDFVALDEGQVRLAEQLRLAGINYHFKVGDEPPPRDAENFSLDEATTALACLDSETSGQLCSRVLGDRKILFSLDHPAPGEPSIHERLFRPERSAQVVWRAVQTQRIVIATLQITMRSVTAIEHQFYENARWLVLHLAFCRLRPEMGESLSLGASEQAQLAAQTESIAREMWEQCLRSGLVRSETISDSTTYQVNRHLKSVFSNPTDCAALREATMGALNRRP